MIEVKSVLAKVLAGFVHYTGGQCKSVCKPVFVLQLVRYCIIWHVKLCRQIAALMLSKLTPFSLVWGVRKGVWGEGVIFWAGGPTLTRDCHDSLLYPPAF